MIYTNEQKIGLSMAVFLASDDYDHDARPNAISATGLLKSVRQTILSQRAESGITSMDISTLVASTFGTAVHDGIEKAWTGDRYKLALAKLGYKQATIDRIVVNPGYMKDPLTGNLVKDPKAKPLEKIHLN